MLVLTIAPENPTHVELKTRIEELSLSKKVIEKEGLEIPTLVEDAEKREGIVPILDYLENMEGFMHQWYQCKCDIVE